MALTLKIDRETQTKIIMKKLLILSLLAIVGLSSCKKQFNENQDIPSNPSKKFSELKASENFDWKTTNAITFKYVGIPTFTPTKTTLSITSEDGKIVYYAGTQDMSSNFETKLAIPSNQSQIIVKYGAVSKTYSTSLSTISFDILPTLDNE